MLAFLTSIKSNFLIFVFCCAVLIGPAYTTLDHFDFSDSPDTKSYMKMAEGDYNVTITHRYRIIVPMLARAVHIPVSFLYSRLWPERSDSHMKGLMMSFFIINTLLASFAGLLIYLICLHYGASPLASLIGLLSYLVSSWAIYAAGLPLVDSLYILVIALTVYGIKANSRLALILSIALGPFAKESYIFIAPLILLLGRHTLSLTYQIPLFLVSGLLVFFSRYYIDKAMGTPLNASMDNALSCIDNITYTLTRVFSFRGAGEIFRVWGLFTFIFLAGFLGGKAARASWIAAMDFLSLGLLISVLIHMLLSGDAGRMLFLASPLFAAAIALIFDRHPYFARLRGVFLSYK